MKKSDIKAAGSELTKNLETGAIYITGSKGKGGSSHTAVEADNTLRSAAVVKVIEVISEGPIVGICGGARGILINSTPLMNADGTYNFPRVGWDYRVGLPSQDYMPGFASASAEVSVNAPLTQATPVIRTTTSVNIDAVKIAMQLPQGLTNQDVTTGDLNGSSVQFRVDVKLTASGAWRTYNNYTITGKTTSAYEAQYRIERPEGSGLWDVRIIRSTEDPGAAVKNQTTVARITEIIDVKLSYNDTAVIGLAIDAESVGSSIPTRSYMVKGKIVSVPTNYTEANIVGGAVGTTGTAYSGIWNGTFQQAWTQNPAWVLYDLLTHPRYGMGEFVSANDIDIYSFYDAAVYNDTLVSDGSGGLESRFTFGGNLLTQEDAGKILQLVAGSFRARLLQINGKWTVLQDRPTSPVRNISNSNVIDGQFVYKSTGLFERHTAFNVTWNNRADRYLQKISTEEDSTGIARYGYFPLDLAAFGATTEGQALRMAKWSLDTEQNQTETVSFKMGLNGFDLLPNDIFNLFDEDYTNVAGGGRIISVVGTTVVLDKPVTLVSGSVISLTLADGITIQAKPIVQTSGTVSTFTVGSAFSTAALEGADYIVTTSVAARQFKVLNLKFPSEMTVEVEALYHDPAKYSRVETGVSIPSEIFSNANAITSTVVVAPTDLTFLETAIVNPDTTITRSISTSWTASNLGSHAVGYQVRYSRNGETSTLLDTPFTMVSIPAVTDGTYDISVIAYDGAGRLCGTALTGSYIINSATAGTLGSVTNLHTKGTSLTTWNTDDLAFNWTANAGNTVPTQDYLVTIKTAGSVTLHNEYVTGTSFMYTLAAMLSDALLAGVTLTPSLLITVTPRDLFNRLGSAVSATFSNAAPAAPTLTLVAGASSVAITVSPCAEADYRGTNIYASTSTGFTPGAGNLVYSGTSNFFLLAGATPLVPLYVKAAHFDAYRTTGLSNSAEYSATPLASAAGAAGTNGDSYRVAYAVATVALLNQTPTTATTTGSTSFPAANAFGGSETWTAATTTLTAGQYQHRLDGIYSPSTGNTVWGKPYQASLKVGNLSAITADLGTITAGNITFDTAGYIKGGMTAYGIGTGFYAGYYLGSYVMSVGNSSSGFAWSGSTFTIKGDLVAGSININNKFMVDSAGVATIKSSTSGARLEMVNDVIRVYDENNILRVKLGNLA